MKPSVLIAAAWLIAALAACVAKPPPPTVSTAVLQTPTGAEIVETAQLTATVAGINYDTRDIVLLGSEGNRIIYKVNKSAVNFDQIKVGDQVKVTATRHLAVSLSKDKAPRAAEGVEVTLAPKGAMPGAVVASTSEVTATVTAVDVGARKVTLQFLDGASETVIVGSAVDLSKVKPGDSVTARLTESVAIAVEKT